MSREEQEHRTVESGRAGDHELLRQIAHNTGRTRKYNFIFGAICSVCAVVIAVTFTFACFTIVPVAVTTLNNLQETSAAVSLLAEDAEITVLEAKTMIEESSKSMEETMTKINSIDFDSLNKSIKHFSEVLEPVSKFFGVFGGGKNTGTDQNTGSGQNTGTNQGTNTDQSTGTGQKSTGTDQSTGTGR